MSSHLLRWEDGPMNWARQDKCSGGYDSWLGLTNKNQATLRVDKQLMGIQALEMGENMGKQSAVEVGENPGAPTGCPLAGAPGYVQKIQIVFTFTSKKNSLELCNWISKVQINQFWIILEYFPLLEKNIVVVMSLWCALSKTRRMVPGVSTKLSKHFLPLLASEGTSLTWTCPRPETWDLLKYIFKRLQPPEGMEVGTFKFQFLSFFASGIKWLRLSSLVFSYIVILSIKWFKCQISTFQCQEPVTSIHLRHLLDATGQQGSCLRLFRKRTLQRIPTDSRCFLWGPWFTNQHFIIQWSSMIQWSSEFGSKKMTMNANRFSNIYPQRSESWFHANGSSVLAVHHCRKRFRA